MRIYRMVLSQFLPVFLLAIAFFMLLLQLLDIFPNLYRYFAHDVSLAEVAWIAVLYVPKCISYSLPVAFLFAISYTLGVLYSHNELFAIFGSGISLYRLVTPFLLLGILISAGSFVFEDRVVITTYAAKNRAYEEAVRVVQSLSQSNVTVTSPDQRVVYQADYYNDAQKRLQGLTVIVRGTDMGVQSRIDAQSAEWRDDHWILRECRVFTWNEETRTLSDERRESYESPLFVEQPDAFKKLARDIAEMSREESETYLTMIRKAGLPVGSLLTDYYRKFSFACTPLIVALIASSLGSTFKKNILLMSLLSALVISVVFYVAQMVAGILSKNGYIPPLAGAWSPFVIFTVVGFMLFRAART